MQILKPSVTVVKINKIMKKMKTTTATDGEGDKELTSQRKY